VGSIDLRRPVAPPSDRSAELFWGLSESVSLTVFPAAWPRTLAPESGSPDLAVHLGPLGVDGNGIANQRTHYGYHVDPAAAGLTPQQVEDAWAGLWNCNPEPYIGSCLIGDVSGFVVAVARITGYQVINRLVRFDLTAPSPEILARYMRHRIAAHPGPPFQAL
jgi:hypothetical protein